MRRTLGYQGKVMLKYGLYLMVALLCHLLYLFWMKSFSDGDAFPQSIAIPGCLVLLAIMAMSFPGTSLSTLMPLAVSFGATRKSWIQAMGIMDGGYAVFSALLGLLLIRLVQKEPWLYSAAAVAFALAAGVLMLVLGAQLSVFVGREHGMVKGSILRFALIGIYPGVAGILFYMGVSGREIVEIAIHPASSFAVLGAAALLFLMIWKYGNRMVVQ